MILLSIDPGLEKTGYAIFDYHQKYHQKFQFLSSGLIKTDKKYSLPRRLQIIYEKLQSIIKKSKPEKIILEQIFFFKNKKTIINVSQAQGVILLLSAFFNLDVYYLTPLEIKQIVTGYGLSDKKAIKKMVDLTLLVKNKKIGDDEYDAIACGLAYCFLNPKLLQ